MKKYAAIFIAMLLVVNITVPAFADSVTYDTPVQGSIAILDGTFAQMNPNNGEATYSGLAVQTSDDLNCTMQFVLHAGSNNYPIEAAGVLEEYISDADTTILHGCLRGSAFIGNTSYNVTVGLTKEEGNSSINAGVVLMPVGEGWSDNVIIFGMGDYVVSPIVSSLIAGDNVSNIYTPANVQAQQGISNALSVSARVLDDIERAVSVRVSLNSAVIQNYIYEHFSYSGSGGGVTYSLSEIQVGARESSPILNLAGPHFPEGYDVDQTDVDVDEFSNLIWAIICDALARFLPTSTLTLLISQLSGRASGPDEVVSYANNNWITLRGNSIFDQIWNYGLACTFATSATASMTPGSATVTGYGNATFYVTQNVPLSGPTTFYLDAEEATAEVTVEVG